MSVSPGYPGLWLDLAITVYEHNQCPDLASKLFCTHGPSQSYQSSRSAVRGFSWPLRHAKAPSRHQRCLAASRFVFLMFGLSVLSPLHLLVHGGPRERLVLSREVRCSFSYESALLTTFCHHIFEAFICVPFYLPVRLCRLVLYRKSS
jgi:hypothetical protein